MLLLAGAEAINLKDDATDAEIEAESNNIEISEEQQSIPDNTTSKAQVKSDPPKNATKASVISKDQIAQKQKKIDHMYDELAQEGEDEINKLTNFAQHVDRK